MTATWLESSHSREIANANVPNVRPISHVKAWVYWQKALQIVRLPGANVHMVKRKPKVKRRSVMGHRNMREAQHATKYMT